jgi:hypothetical protein
MGSSGDLSWVFSFSTSLKYSLTQAARFKLTSNCYKKPLEKANKGIKKIRRKGNIQKEQFLVLMLHVYLL